MSKMFVENFLVIHYSTCSLLTPKLYGLHTDFGQRIRIWSVKNIGCGQEFLRHLETLKSMKY